jgi:hypothetical protein
MKKFLAKPINTFLVLFISLLLTFFLLPINIFDGEIVYQQGIQKIVEQRPLSLYFISGLEYDKAQLVGVKEYYLLPKGYFMAFLFIFCIPLLLAFRVSLGKKNSAKS